MASNRGKTHLRFIRKRRALGKARKRVERSKGSTPKFSIHKEDKK